MGLNAVLKDKARIIERRPLPVKVNGRTTFTTVTHPWFKARVQMPKKPRTADPAGGRQRNEVRPVLIYGLKDEEGSPVVVTTEVIVEVLSPELGENSTHYRVDTDPEPYRKKKKVIGYETSIVRIESHEFEAA
jgi:hypothetical protein